MRIWGAAPANAMRGRTKAERKAALTRGPVDVVGRGLGGDRRRVKRHGTAKRWQPNPEHLRRISASEA